MRENREGGAPAVLKSVIEIGLKVCHMTEVETKLFLEVKENEEKGADAFSVVAVSICGNVIMQSIEILGKLNAVVIMMLPVDNNAIICALNVR